MRPGCGTVLFLVLLCCSCDALGYRVEWRGFKGEETSNEDSQRQGIELFGHSTAERTASLAWIHWETQHRDLARALDRNTHSPALAPYYDRCTEALQQIEREQPELEPTLEVAASRYQSLREQARDANPRWISRQLRKIADLVESSSEQAAESTSK